VTSKDLKGELKDVMDSDFTRPPTAYNQSPNKSFSISKNFNQRNFLPRLHFALKQEEDNTLLAQHATYTLFNALRKAEFRVVVFHDRLPSHLFYTSKSASQIKLESSSTGSSFPAGIAKPVPFAVSSQARELGQ